MSNLMMNLSRFFIRRFFLRSLAVWVAFVLLCTIAGSVLGAIGDPRFVLFYLPVVASFMVTVPVFLIVVSIWMIKELWNEGRP